MNQNIKIKGVFVSSKKMITIFHYNTILKKKKIGQIYTLLI